MEVGKKNFKNLKFLKNFKFLKFFDDDARAPPKILINLIWPDFATVQWPKLPDPVSTLPVITSNYRS